MPATKSKTKTANEPKKYPREGLATVPDAAEFLACSRNSVYRMIDEGTLPSKAVMSGKRIPWAALHEYVGTKTDQA